MLSCASVYWCLVVTCWERADLLALVCDLELWSCHFPIGILAHVWCLIVSIPDLCLFSYFDQCWIDFIKHSTRHMVRGRGLMLINLSLDVFGILLLKSTWQVHIFSYQLCTNRFFLLVWYNKLEMVHYINRGVKGYVPKQSCISFSENHFYINKQCRSWWNTHIGARTHAHIHTHWMKEKCYNTLMYRK